jgi:FKBP12-rapamycin complex-associated protein
MGRHRMPTHSAFTRVAGKLLLHEPPCMSEADDWESSSGFLVEEHLAAKPRQSTPDRLHLERTLTLQSGAGGQCAFGWGDGWLLKVPGCNDL